MFCHLSGKGSNGRFLRLRSSKITLTKAGKERATGKKGEEEKKDSFGRFVFFFRRDSFWPKKKKRPFEGGDLSIRLDMKFSDVTIQVKRFLL